MTDVVSLAILSLVGTITFAALVRPFVRPASHHLQPLSSPLQDRRGALLLALKDIDAALDDGALTATDHARLRDDMERRLIAVLKALDEQQSGDSPAVEPLELAQGLSPYGPGVSTGGIAATPRWVVVSLFAGAISAVVIASVVLSVKPRLEATAMAPTDPVSFFASRVSADPANVDARLDLAQAYLGGGDVVDAAEQFSAVLSVQPHQPEALAYMGLLDDVGGDPATGLELVDEALQLNPGFAEAYFLRGAVLIDLGRYPDAIAALREYLARAPFGTHRSEADQLIRQSTAASG